MKKSTFFLSLFLTFLGVATTNAQNTVLKAEDIKDGRVIALYGNGRYLKLDDAGLDNFDPKETAVVVEKADENGTFYLKKYSTGLYLQKAGGNGVAVTFGDDKEEAASFTIDKNVTPKVRFVTTAINGTMVFLNTNGADKISSYYNGTGDNGKLDVYDAAERCKTLVKDVVYVGDLVFTEEMKTKVQTAYETYNTEQNETNYTEISDVVKSASPAEFDASLYYLIENNYDKGTYMETTDDQKLSWSAGISGSASQIWYFETEETETEETETEETEAVAEETEEGVVKYFMSTQGVFCNEPQDDTPVTLSDDRASFYIIEMSAGVYAFDSGLNYAADRATNKGKGLHKNTDANNNHIVKGWGTYAGLSQWKLRFAKTYTLEMPTKGWTTLYLPFAVSLPENLTALYPTDAKKYIDTDNGQQVNSVTMTELTDKKVPANFPVVLQGKADNYTLTILPADHEISKEDDWEKNKFEGVLLRKPVNTAAMFNLKLNDDGTFTLSEPEEGESEVNVEANSAYIPSNNVTTGIIDVVAADTNADNVWFDLVGRRVLNPAKGVYVNAAGKKALFK